MNIYEKMSAITLELQTVAKNLSVDTGRNQSYKAVSERDVLDAVKPVEAKYGVYSYPVSREVIESQTLESENQYGKKTTFFTRVKTVYRFVNVEEPSDYIETTVFSEGVDSQDKGSGKAMTYADKYALLKAYKISTGDDPEQTASQDTYYRSDNVEYCECCGQAIKPIKSGGKVYTMQEIARNAREKYGKTMCWSCMREAKC